MENWQESRLLAPFVGLLFGALLVAGVSASAADRVHVEELAQEEDNHLLTRGGVPRRALSERSILQDASTPLPPFAMFSEVDPVVPDDGPIKKGNKAAGEKSYGLHFTLDQQEIFERAHGNPNWPNPNNGNGNGPSGNGNGQGLGYGLTKPEEPAGVACTVTDNCVIPSQNPPITYHGGPTMFLTKQFPTISSYVIFYGDASSWTDSTSVSIVTDFFKSVGNSDYFQINQGNMFTDPTSSNDAGYYYSSAAYPQAFPPNGAGNPAFGGFVFDRSWRKGQKLGQSSFQAIISNAVSKSVRGISSTRNSATLEYPAQGLPVDGSGIYFVLTAPGLSQSIAGFCTQFCGYHTFYQQTGVVSGPWAPSVYLKWAFIGDPANCMSSCSAYNRQVSPNGRPSIDALVSVVAHELEETVTDVSNAWYDANGAENADKCAWVYGALSGGTSSTGAAYYYNTVLGSRQYLIQMNYLNDQNGLGYCAMSYNYPHQVPVY